MKKVRMFFFALAALMLGACSSDDAIVEGGKGPSWNSDGKGYVNLSIQLPTQQGTRAWTDDDKFDDGTPAEYDVKDATLILFAGDEGSETVNSAYAMALNFSPNGTATDQISTSAKITQEINSIDAASIKALVVLNNNNLFTVKDGKLMQDQTDLTGKTLDELNDALKSVSASYSWHANGLLMSNAVMASAQGGTVAPTAAKVVGPLVKIEASKIHKTKAEADVDPAATIYVERAEGKVTVTAEAGNTTASKLAYTIIGWALDNTSKKNFLVRSVKNFDTWKAYKSDKVTGDDYRMVGNAAIAQGLYRLYWAEDANYSGSLTAADEYVTVGSALATIDNGNMKPADGKTADYCFENTTDLANMHGEHLTRIIVKAQFNGGTSFYTVDDNRENAAALWTEDAVKKEVAARLLTDPAIDTWAKKNVKQGQTLSSATDFDITLSTEKAGKRTVATVALNATGKAKLNDSPEEFPANAAELVNKRIALAYYEGGAAYYPVYIAHFGQAQTPWEADYETGNGLYNDNSQRYLGRFGVVRNNWYEVSVTSIKALGSPTVTEVAGDEADKKESYIAVRINVLSWAKRAQSVEL